MHPALFSRYWISSMWCIKISGETSTVAVLRSAMWRRVNNVIGQEEQPPACIPRRETRRRRERCAPGDEHLLASRCFSADSWVSVLYKGDYSFLRIAVVSHNVTRVKRTFVRRLARFDPREEEPILLPEALERNWQKCASHTRVAARVGRYNDRFFPEAVCDRSARLLRKSIFSDQRTCFSIFILCNSVKSNCVMLHR